MAARPLLTCLLITFLQVFSAVAQCPGDLTANNSMQYMMSPGYPDMYPPDLNCAFKITAQPGEVVYLESLEVHLYKNDDCDDNIKIYSGGNATGTFKQVCGMDMVIFQSTEMNAFITFTTNGNREAKGFALRYWSAPAFTPSCGQVENVGNVPVFIKFPKENKPEHCNYTLRAGADHVVSLDLIGWESLKSVECDKNNSFVITDDGSNIINHCGPHRPFWHYISKGENVDVSFMTTLDEESKPFYLKVTAMSTTVTTCSDTRIGPIATYMWFPLFKKGSTFCATTLLAPETTVGVEVATPLCNNTELPSLDFELEEDGSKKNMSCMKGKANYSSISKDLKLMPVGDTPSPALLKVASFDIKQCNRVEELLATRTKKTLMTPNFPNGYPINALCSWRFVSYRSDYVVVIEVDESDLPDNCNDMGFVNDGEQEINDRLGEWCGKRTPKYRGTGQTLLLTFDADHMNSTHKGFKFTYYADNKVAREIVAGTDVMTIAAVFTIIIIAGGIIFILYRLFTRNKAKRKAKNDDRQPITQ